MSKKRNKYTDRSVEDLLSDPDFRRDFEKEKARLAELYRPLIEAIRSSERLTEKDFGIVINARADDAP